MTDALIGLKTREPEAVGGHRSVYVHPGDASLCIKVLHEPWRQIGRRLNDPFRHLRLRRHFDENRGELHELKRMQRRLGPLLVAHFPMPHGLIETDLGEGLVVDRISDLDGQTSLTLKNYIWIHDLDEPCRAALDSFWDFLYSHRVPVKDPVPHNLVVQRRTDGHLRIVMIDGFGSSDFLPFRYWFSASAIRKLKSRRQRMQRHIDKELARKRSGESPKGKGVVRRV